MFLCRRGLKRISAVLVALLMTGSVAGCGASSAENQQTEMPVQTPSIGNVPKVVNSEYTVPVQTPGILLDQIGYGQSSEKTVLFACKELPETFVIKRLDDDKEVYKGEVIKSVWDKDAGRYIGIGRFNDLKEIGTYYISADTVGESYSFSIKEDAYGELLDEACKRYYVNRCGVASSDHSACHTATAHLQESPEVDLDVTGGWHMDEQAGRDALTGCRIIENLMMAYEMNPEAFSDETGITESGNGIPDILDEVKYEAEWLLKMQDSKTGGVYGAAITATDKSQDILFAPVNVTPVSMDATIAFAAAMSEFSYFYQQFDPEYATGALKAADRAWTSYLNNKKASDNTASFKAAASLYRATGSDKYKTVMETFFAGADFEKSFGEDENIFLGSVTYLSTKQNVDKEQCAILMKALMNRSEAIAHRAGENSYLIADDTADGSFGKILDDMRCLSVTNHIIYNYEYTTIIENHVHYLLGMNPEALNYVTDSTEHTYKDMKGKAGLMSNPQQNAILIIMLSGV